MLRDGAEEVFGAWTGANLEASRSPVEDETRPGGPRGVCAEAQPRAEGH